MMSTKQQFYTCPICKEKSDSVAWNNASYGFYSNEPYYDESQGLIEIQEEDIFTSHICPSCEREVDMDNIIKVMQEEFEDTEKEEDILEKINELWSLINELKPHHPSEINDFYDAIHKLQYIVGMRFARISREDLFPRKD